MKILVATLALITIVALIFVGLHFNNRTPDGGASTQTSGALTLSDKDIKAIIDEQRATRSDLPDPFPEYEWNVRKQGSHYVYLEYGLPKSPGYNQIFKLNKRGVIVDVDNTKDPTLSVDCPDKVFSKSELAAIIEKERAARSDLPAPFPKYRVRVDRLRCLYMYYEYALPEVPGKHHVFIIDPFGELMEVFRSRPYQQ